MTSRDSIEPTLPQSEPRASTWHKVARFSQLEEQYPTRAKIGAREVAISLVEGEVFVTDNICSHAFARLSDGYLEGFEIICPLHGGSFDVRTGEAVATPCQTPIAVYECRVDGDDVIMRIDDGAAPSPGGAQESSGE